MVGYCELTHRGSKTERRAVELLELKWERQPEPCHDYLLFLTRSPDSLRMATASSDFHIDQVTEIWDLPERRMIHRLQTPNAETMSLEWLQQDAFVTGGYNCLLTVWQADRVVSRYCLLSLAGHSTWLKSLAACDSTLLSGDVGSILGIWDLPSLRNTRMFLHPNHDEMELNALMSLAFLPGSNSCFYMIQRVGRLSIGDLRGKNLIQWTSRLDMTKLANMKIMENPHQVAISARENDIKLWDIRSSPIHIQKYCQHQSASLPLGFDFLCYEKYLATGSDDGCVYIYDTLTGSLIRKIKLGHGQVQTCCAESLDSLSFFASFDNARCLGLIDTEGIGNLHEANSTEQIKEGYSKTAWSIALSKYSERLALQVQHLTGETHYGQDNWLEVLRGSEARESRELLSAVEAEYRTQVQLSVPALVSDLNAFFQRNKAFEMIADKPCPRPVVRFCSSFAPRVRREAAFYSN